MYNDFIACIKSNFRNQTLRTVYSTVRTILGMYVLFEEYVQLWSGVTFSPCAQNQKHVYFAKRSSIS